MNKEYIGDGIYIEHNDYAYILTTENGIEVTNRIVIEPTELKLIMKYAELIIAKRNSK